MVRILVRLRPLSQALRVQGRHGSRAFSRSADRTTPPSQERSGTRPWLRRRSSLQAPCVEGSSGCRPRPGRRQHQGGEEIRAAWTPLCPARHAGLIRPQRLRLRLQLLHELRLFRQAGRASGCRSKHGVSAASRRQAGARLPECPVRRNTTDVRRGQGDRRRDLPSLALDGRAFVLQADRGRGPAAVRRSNTSSASPGSRCGTSNGCSRVTTSASRKCTATTA